MKAEAERAVYEISVDDLQRVAKEVLERELTDDEITAVGNSGRFSVALSGGSTPRGLFALLAADRKWRKQMPWKQMHFFWGDERHVSPDDPDSNFRMANETLLSNVPVPAEMMLSLKVALRAVSAPL